MKRNIKRWFSLLGIMFAFAFASQVFAQEKKSQEAPKTPPKSAPAKTSPDLTEWKILLDHLAVEARTLDADEPEILMAEVADAYWRLDANRSKALFTDAFERSYAAPGAQRTVQTILSLVAKRDRALAVSFAKQLFESRKDGSESRYEASGEALVVARDLLDTDQATAVDFARAAAAFGPSFSGMSFLFKLAEKDPAAADQLYEVYLKQLSTRGNPPLRSVLWLAGYPFGYGEAYGGSNDPAELGGFGAVRLDKLRANPNLARAYLQLAFVSVTNTLRDAAATSDQNARDELNGVALFATSYLFPEVQHYLPGAEGAWSGVHRQALSTTSGPRRAAVEARLEYFLEIRSRAMKYKSTEDFLAEGARDKAELINKLPAGCKRDQARAELALDLAAAKKFAEARQTAGDIEDLTLRDNVLEFVNCNVALAAIEAGNLVDATSLAEKVTAKDQRAMLLVKIAAGSLKKGDKPGALDSLNRARSLVTQTDEPELQSAVLTAIASVYIRFDPLEAVMVLRDAIKAFNRVKDQSSERFSVSRYVNMGCDQQPQLYASRETTDTSSLYETLAAIANSSVQGQEALLIASELENKATRLRAQLSIVKAVVKDK